MRCSSTVSAPVQHCCAPLTAHHSRYIAVQLLTNQVLYFIAETKSKTKDVYAQICIYLAGQGMLDCELFGLAIMCDGEYIFVDPESKLSKYAPKNWKSSSSHGLDGHGNPVFVLHFRVQFYVDTPLLLRDDITRHNYYLQLRDNAISRGQVTFCSSDELLLLLAGYALQADYGDYNESEHKISYFQLEKYFPKELITRNSQIFKTAIALHKDNRGLSAAEAEMQYIKEASSNEITLLTHNLHLYKLKNHKKQEMDRSSVWLAICARGIQIYEETQFKKSLSTTFLWNNIGKLCFDRKKFEIKALSPSSEKMTYYTSSDEKSKHLLFLCRVTHQFSMSLQARLSEAKKKEEEERKKCRDSFAYERGITSEFPSLAKINRNSSRYKNLRSDQRISVISNTSSNTTSGIVSDRVQSLDESEDDLEIEIMINSPPNNSVESLALAHLKDAPLQEESSCELTSPVTGDTVNSLVGCHCNQKSPSLGGPATPATTDGSQCSSSCSTVVIAEVGANSSSLSVSSFTKPQNNSPRRSSTTSSLELGYSHTAQNSVVSDSISCLELDLSVQNAQFGLSEKIDCDSSKKSYSFKSLLKNRTDSKTSTFSFGKINKIRTSSNFQIENSDKEIRTSRSSSLKSFSTYKRERELTNDSENTHNPEIEFSNRIATHVGNGSDLDTTSSGIYTNSNDLDSNSNRAYLSADLENGSSGIFTLPSTTEPDLQTNACSSETSGVYGIINSVADTSSTSECCGVYAVMEPMRERSGSNASVVSASGSFHGDGSDPSEAGKGTLLTAKELSDLIVGKTHNSGSYPSRATVSNTLDSDSDYVTLPPPPRFPTSSDNDFVASNQLNDRPLSAFPKNLKQNYLDNGRQKQPIFSPNLLNENKFLMPRQDFKKRVDQVGEQNHQNCSTLLHQSSSTQQYSSSLTTLLAQMRPFSTLACPTEEANARFITTKPHISMITHSNLSSSSVTPNYASPTHSAFNYSENGRVQNDNILYPNICNNATSNYLDQNAQLYHSSEGISSNLNHPVPLPQRSFLNNIEKCNNYCSSTYSVEPTPSKKYPTKNYQLDPGSKMKLNSLSMLPIVGKNNYLDIHASKAINLMPMRSVAYHRAFSPLPPPVISRQPPPPPPLATVYTSQVTRSQIEQFKQQLYSDVDYVIYPMKDPAISKQEYIDAKQGSLLAAMANGYPHLYPPPPPYPCAKTHVVYRSAPNVAIGNGYLPVNFTNQSVANKYSSNTHLNQSSDQLFGYQTYLPQPSHYSSTSPLYSTTSYSSSSSQSLRCEPSPLADYLIPHPLSSIPGNSLSFSRTRSDDNLLNSYQNPTNMPRLENKFRRYPPPPPPPPYEMRQSAQPVPDYKVHKPANLKPKSKSDFNKFEGFNEPSKNLKTGEEKKNIKTVSKDPKKDMSPSSSLKKTLIDDKGKIIDIHALIEKSKNLDLPLISALCNDKSLIRQTNAFVMPKHPGVGRCSSNHGLKSANSASKKIVEKERPSSFHVESKNGSKSGKTQKIQDEFSNSLTTVNDSTKTSKSATLLETLFSVKSSKNYSSSSKLKYPVSGLSTTQISKPQKKFSSAHVHPKDTTKVGDGTVIGSVKTKIKTANAIKNKDALVP